MEEEYFLQLLFEINPEKNIIPFTEVLLWNMFKEQNILFTEVTVHVGINHMHSVEVVCMLKLSTQKRREKKCMKISVEIKYRFFKQIINIMTVIFRNNRPRIHVFKPFFGHLICLECVSFDFPQMLD